MESKYQQYKDQGLVMFTLMGENNNGGVPSQSDLQAWANVGASYWIVSDANSGYINKFWPTAMYWGMDKLLKPGVEVVDDNPVGQIKPYN
ncbi:MAG: hypothetical protein B7733_18195 [Myxococcales bacterium FL481]|nr:MAG: hypothetical protein B7733_18195 [Myxococcales bacterium FL481]